MTKISRPINKTMQDIASDWSNTHWCYDRVSDLEAFGKLIRQRTLFEVWLYIQKSNYNIDTNVEQFVKDMEE